MKFVRFLIAVPVVLVLWAFTTLGLLFSILLVPLGIGVFSVIGCMGMYAGSLTLGVKFVRGTLRD